MVVKDMRMSKRRYLIKTVTKIGQIVGSSNKVLAEMSDEIDELLEAEITQVAERK